MKKTTVILVIAMLGCFIVGGAIAYFFTKRTVVQDQVAASVSTPRLEIDQILAKISTTVQVPRDEVPSLATVTDPEKLQDQQFFKQAEAGDKVILYTEAARAVLYRPKTGKVIETGPFILTNPTENPLTSATPPTAK